MSMDRCRYCSRLVDTDDDPDCYQPYPSHPVKGAPDICVCEPCRDRLEDEIGREPPDREFLLEQQATIDRIIAEQAHLHQDQARESRIEGEAMSEKLLDCPFCGAPAEMDAAQGYLAMPSGKMGTRVAIYCTSCAADMGWCREDHPDMEIEQIIYCVTEDWNRRASQPQPERAGDISYARKCWTDEIKTSCRNRCAEFGEPACFDMIAWATPCLDCSPRAAPHTGS